MSYKCDLAIMVHSSIAKCVQNCGSQIVQLDICAVLCRAYDISAHGSSCRSQRQVCRATHLYNKANFENSR